MSKRKITAKKKTFTLENGSLPGEFIADNRSRRRMCREFELNDLKELDTFENRFDEFYDKAVRVIEAAERQLRKAKELKDEEKLSKCCCCGYGCDCDFDCDDYETDVEDTIMESFIQDEDLSDEDSDENNPNAADLEIAFLKVIYEMAKANRHLEGYSRTLYEMLNSADSIGLNFKETIDFILNDKTGRKLLLNVISENHNVVIGGDEDE